MSDFVAFSVDSSAIFADFESLLIRKRAKSGRLAHIRDARSYRQVPLLPSCPSLGRNRDRCLLSHALAVSNRVGLSGLTINGGPHGFAELLFAYTSCFPNNRQSFASLNLIEICFQDDPSFRVRS